MATTVTIGIPDTQGYNVGLVGNGAPPNGSIVVQLTDSTTTLVFYSPTGLRTLANVLGAAADDWERMEADQLATLSAATEDEQTANLDPTAET